MLAADDEIPDDVKNFEIGGYNAFRKWNKSLKDQIPFEDFNYRRTKVLHSIIKTTELMEKIDKTINNTQVWPLK